jgi:hypothetical protein
MQMYQSKVDEKIVCVGIKIHDTNFENKYISLHAWWKFAKWK